MNKKQCEAVTKKGTQCKRTAKEPGCYCWQHIKLGCSGK